jgi:ATP:corrinoid adenosyltransferase
MNEVVQDVDGLMDEVCLMVLGDLLDVDEVVLVLDGLMDEDEVVLVLGVVYL